jgi:hypothetical protein
MDTYSGSSSSADYAIHPHIVWREMSAPCRSKIFCCRFNGK